MGSYRDIEGELRGKTNVRILILDTGNIQFHIILVNFNMFRQFQPRFIILMRLKIICR